MTAVLPDLAHLAGLPQHRGGSAELVWDEYLHVIRESLAGHERSLQTRIGPSGIGTECPKCLARQLAQIPERRGEDWLPYVGTCVHDGLQDIFLAWNAARPALPVRFLTELEVSVGTVGGVNITGHLDLYDTAVAEVTDWKIVGAATLTKVKANGLPSVYRAQAHLYGLGCLRRGLPVERVRVAFLPRNAMTLRASVIVTEQFDPAVAVAALDRANALCSAAETLGWPALIDSLPVVDGCYSCPRYPQPDGTYPQTRASSAYDPFADIA